MHNALRKLNQMHTRCNCLDCNLAHRTNHDERADREAVCTFSPWFESVLHERGLVVLRKEFNAIRFTHGPYNENERFWTPLLSDDDCHLVESPNMRPGQDAVRWRDVWIGKKLWNVESINNHWIKQFERVFSTNSGTKPLSSPPTPPGSPKMAPQPPPPLPITTTINQGLELQELKKQLATQAAELQFCSFQQIFLESSCIELHKQLATQALELHTLKQQLATHAAQLEHEGDDKKRKRP